MNEYMHLYRFLRRTIILMALTAGLNGMVIVAPAVSQEVEELDPAEITNGERLFLETRFAQLFKTFLDNGGDTNAPLTEGDPSLDKAVNWQLPTDQLADGPFAGQSMNCRSCHFVDELGMEDPLAGYGMRTYSDFARRSPIPSREDGKTVTVRNSPPLVNASLPRKNFFLHFDAEFKTMVDLVKGTLSGRNYGWLADESSVAISHVARIVREDDGTGDLASEFESLSYTTLLTGTDPTLPDGFVLPEEFRVDVDKATDREIFLAVSKLITAYTDDLAFSQDDDGNFNLSPYDVFLETNGLPRQPRQWESDLSYSKRLLRKVKRLEQQGQIQFVTTNPNTTDGNFEFHDQLFVFGEAELQGLKIFFNGKKRRIRPSDLAQGKIGNCTSCHAAPNFTDFQLHNTGIAQAEYDSIHGTGAFANLSIPNLLRRLRNPNAFLPATEQHPTAEEPFRATPSASTPEQTDLGVWNIFANPDFPKPQARIWRTLCNDVLNGNYQIWNIIRKCRVSRLLPKSIARFKTPGLRDLSHSAPYSHTGQADTLEDVIRGYIKNADLRRDGALRNGDRRLKGIALVEEDIAPLTAFLKSLNEDYN